ncbi:hypothetical protein BDQ94DRAFT_138389 [Aspergillus welwitschiae]|uniref:Uncharacterized protein n=1 Tax=Aspergillus welwitschiae TaxID=1341132 RepID=A0A3F3QC34_9EURO|nr:hypothetical protein BDQ94DRAFT_138389 [Aspergillus welwitschiae]RDH36761.1 hypothetical protein BDQ94DRAFT_138389 [Aspergillus welwitschiae]
MVPFQNAVYFCRRGSLPRGGQSLAWEAQKDIVGNGPCRDMQHVLLQGSEAPRSDIRGAENQEVSLVVLESRMAK